MDVRPPRLEVVVVNVGDTTMGMVYVYMSTASSPLGKYTYGARMKEIKPGVAKGVEHADPSSRCQLM